MSLSKSIEGTILGTVVKKIAASEPRTTILGTVLGGVVLAQIDYGKLLAGDPTQIGNAVAAIVVAVIGYYTNHPSLTQPPSPPKP